MKKIVLMFLMLSVGVKALADEPKKTFDRGLGDASSIFVPKGMMSLGASLSYSRYSAGNGDVGYEMMSLLTGMQGSFLL